MPAEATTGHWGRWGDDDEVGAANLVGPAEVVAAAGLVRTGRVLRLGIDLGPATPAPPHRASPVRYMTRDAGDYAAGARRPDGFCFAEEVWTFPAHSGTHVDALSHVWYDDRLYNGFPASGTRSTTGARRCGAEHLAPLVTRGVLVDLVGGADPLGPSEAIDASRLAAAGLDPRPGDVVLVRTGWMEAAGADPGRYFATEPGIDASAAGWLAGAGVVAVGADNYAVEVQPSAPGSTFPAHQVLIRDHGIPLFEGVPLTELAGALGEAGRSDFCFVSSPLPLVGGTASPVCPLAIL